MHIILGATGHVGSAVVHALLERAEPVTAVVRDLDKASALRQRGAQVVAADVHDAAALRQIFARGHTLFLLNPPAAPSSDTDREERGTMRSILAALAGSGLQRVVAESTYGAQPGTRIGDLGVLYELEQALFAQVIPTLVLRAAYYMSNWDALLEPARREGKVESLYPSDFAFPMVAPHDIAQAAVGLLHTSELAPAVKHVEGPARYRVRDVAEALGAALHRQISACEIAAERWPAALRALGFSDEAAESFAGMTRASLCARYPAPEQTTRGSTTLQQYIDGLVARAHGPR